MKEQSKNPSSPNVPVDKQSIEFIDPILGVHSDLATHELVLPRAVSREKFDFIADAYNGGAFEGLEQDRREVVLVYFTSECTTGNIPGYTKGVAQNHVIYGLRGVWQNTSPQTHEKYSQSLATSLKDRYSQRRGRPLSEAQKRVIQLAQEARRNNDYYRKRIASTLISKVTPEMRQRSRDGALLYGISNRRKIAETDPEKAKMLEEAALKRMRKKLLEKIINLRSQKYPDYVPPVKEKAELTKIKKPEVKVQDKESVKPEETVNPPTTQEPKVVAQSKKPDFRVEERLEDPLIGALRNLRFLQEELPVEIVQEFKGRPGLSVEWKTIHAIINSYPYFRYENGGLCYVVPGPDERDLNYKVTRKLLNSLWNGGKTYVQKDRDNIQKFGRISIEELGTTLKNALAVS